MVDVLRTDYMSSKFKSYADMYWEFEDAALCVRCRFLPQLE